MNLSKRQHLPRRGLAGRNRPNAPFGHLFRSYNPERTGGLFLASRAGLILDSASALILLMYGTALRTSETVGLDVGDVDLDRQLIRVRKTKFYKTRLIPLGHDLAQELAAYVADRNRHHSTASSAPLFVYRKGQRLSADAARAHFRCLCRLAGLGIQAGAAAEPRLHDLRHSAIVHRVLAWYREGRDVQVLLPKLSTYVGHKDVACTQRYLRLIPELLDQASRRFATHAREVYEHA